MRMDPKQLRIYAVTDKSWLKPGETLEQVVEELLKAGVTCVQLRDKTADDGLLLKEAETLNALCRQYEVPLIINDRPDIAKKAGAAGVHVGLSDMGIAEARKILGPAEVPTARKKHWRQKKPGQIIWDAARFLEAIQRQTQAIFPRNALPPSAG